MLSDAIRQLGERIKTGVSAEDPRGLVLTLKALEMEARNMEERLELITGRSHAPLDGQLMTLPLLEAKRAATHR